MTPLRGTSSIAGARYHTPSDGTEGESESPGDQLLSHPCYRMGQGEASGHTGAFPTQLTPCLVAGIHWTVDGLYGDDNAVLTLMAVSRYHRVAGGPLSPICACACAA